MKKKLLLIPFTIIASVAVFGPMASGATMQVTMNYGSRHYSDGGEFNASSPDFLPSNMGYAANTRVNGGFETFCVETNEYFSPGSPYYYGISQKAINGGAGGGSPDPISRGTAWLYLKFATDTLTGYDYTVGPGGDTSAGQLQATIWWLEGELSGPAPNNIFTTQVMNLAGYTLDNDGYYHVGVLNLWGDIDHTQLAQDQLILIPGPNLFQNVPDEGSTAMLLGLGFLGLFVGRWKLDRRSHAA